MALPYQPLDKYGDEFYLTRSGSSGQIYRSRSDNNFILKAIPNNQDDQVKFLPSFQVIDEVVATLNAKSPFVIPLLDVIIEAKTTYLVYPKAKYDFDYILSRVDLLASLPTYLFFLQLYQGVADLHNNDILHLDLKPENLVVHGTNNNLWLIDLGLSYLHQCSLPPLRPNFFQEFATPPYRSPELFYGRSSH